MTVISLSVGFLSLPANLMRKLVSSENLNICSGEDGVLKFVLSWINHDPHSRLEHFPEVMKNVRLPLIPRNLLAESLGSEFEELGENGKLHFLQNLCFVFYIEFYSC